jgi:O-antigen/teichoic acid export membrane protein
MPDAKGLQPEPRDADRVGVRNSSTPGLPGDEPRDDAAATTGASVLRGGVWNLVGLFVPQLSLLAISIAAARFLGRDQFGRQSFIAFVEVTALTLCAAGLPVALARFVGEAVGRRSPGVVVGLSRWVGRMALVSGVAGAGVVAGIGLAGATPRAAWLLAAVVVLAGTVQRLPSAVLNGLQRWRAPSVVGVAMAVAAAVATVGVLAAGGRIVAMFAVEAAAMLVSLVWLWALSRRAQPDLGAPAPVEPPLRRAFRGFAFVASLEVLLTLVVWRRSEFLFLNHYSSDSQIALYSVAFSAVAALLLVPQALVGVLLPAIATLLGAGATDRIRWGFERAIRLLLVMTLPMTAVALALAPPTLRVVYGQDFRGAGPVVVVLLVPLSILALTNLSAVVLAGMGRQGFQLATGAVGALVNVGLDLVLIPRYDAVGAAFANCGGQLAAGLPVLVYAWRRIGVTRWEPGALARTAVASIGAGLTGWLVQRWLGGAPGVLLGLAAASVAFAALAAKLRILITEDAMWLEDSLGRPLGGRVGRAIRMCAPPASQAETG